MITNERTSGEHHQVWMLFLPIEIISIISKPYTRVPIVFLFPSVNATNAGDLWYSAMIRYCRNVITISNNFLNYFTIVGRFAHFSGSTSYSIMSNYRHHRNQLQYIRICCSFRRNRLIKYAYKAEKNIFQRSKVTGNTAKHPTFKFLVLDFVSF